MKTKEFKLGDILHKVSLKTVPGGSGELPKTQTKEHPMPALTAVTTNNGFEKYVSNNTGATVLSDVISISEGVYCSAFYQPYDFVVVSHAYIVDTNEQLPPFVKQYITISMNKILKEKYSWSYSPSWGKFKDETIPLPVKDDGTPDYELMDKKMRSPQFVQIKAIRDYLDKDGYASLSDTVIAPQEEAGVEKYWAVTKKEFKLDELLHKVSFKNVPSGSGELPNKPDNKHTMPGLTSGATNDGLNKYVSKDVDATVLSNVISVASTGACQAFYQPDDFMVIQNAYVIDTKEQVSSFVKMYITIPMNKILIAKYSYSNVPGWGKFKDETIPLPVKDDGTPNYELIDNVMLVAHKKNVAQVLKQLDKQTQELERKMVK